MIVNLLNHRIVELEIISVVVEPNLFIFQEMESVIPQVVIHSLTVTLVAELELNAQMLVSRFLVQCSLCYILLSRQTNELPSQIIYVAIRVNSFPYAFFSFLF